MTRPETEGSWNWEPTLNEQIDLGEGATFESWDTPNGPEHHVHLANGTSVIMAAYHNEGAAFVAKPGESLRAWRP